MKLHFCILILAFVYGISISQNTCSNTSQPDHTHLSIDSIIIEGNTAANDTWYKKILPFKEGDTFDSALYKSTQRIITDSLYSRGHLFAEIQYFTSVNSTNNTVSIYYLVYEGPVLLTGNIEIVGLDQVKAIVVERELFLKTNQILTPQKIQLSIRQLYRTGLFSFVIIEPLDTFHRYTELDTVKMPILIQVEETNMVNLQIGGGYSSIEGLLGNLVFSHKNLFRLGHAVSLTGKISSVSAGGSLAYTYPHVFSTGLSADFRGYIERFSWDTYKEVLSGTTLGIGGSAKVYNSWRTWTSFKHQHFISKPESHSQLNLSNSNTILLGSSIQRDTRNTYFSPGNAILAMLTGELAGFTVWSNQFYRIQSDFRIYRSFFDNSLIAGSALFLGYVNEYGSGKTIPPSELFRSGFGMVRPVRGYDENEISPLLDNDITGGKLALTFNAVNLIFPIYEILKGEAFIDAGKIWTTPSSFSFRDFKWSVGAGLILATQSFPARIDYGIKLDRNRRFDGNIYFALGYPF
ncbi:MAG: BamA/TamA family outer membrane protein [Fibrobacter sp.]|nr:BamA/TamA family outer membrane protein [Fibrobacter sp.]